MKQETSALTNKFLQLIIIRIAKILSLAIALLIVQCTSIEERQAIAKKDFDTYSKNWQKPIVDYDSIPPNKNEEYGKVVFIPPLDIEESPVAFSRDGKYIFTKNSSRTNEERNELFLWDLDGNRIRKFPGELHSLSPNGKYLLTTEDSKYILMDINGNEIKLLDKKEFDGNVNFSSDGKYLLARSFYKKLVKIMDLNGKDIYDFDGNTVLSNDGKYILTSSKDSSIKLMDIMGNELRTFQGNFANFSPDGMHIITYNYISKNDFLIKLLDFNGKEISAFKYEEFVTFTPDGKHLFTKKSDRIIIRDMKGEIIKEFKEKEFYLTYNQKLIISPDGKYFFGKNDYGAGVWDIKGRMISIIGTSYGDIANAFSPDGKYIFIENKERDGNISKIIDIEGNVISEFSKFSILSPDWKYVFSIDKKDKILWDTSKNKIKTFGGYFNEIERPAVRFPKAGKNIFLRRGYTLDGYRDYTGTWIFNTNSGEIKTIRKKAYEISPDGNRIIVGSDEHHELLDINGDIIKKIDSTYFSCEKCRAFSPDGKFFAIARGHDIKLYDRDGKEIITIKNKDYTRFIEFSPNGKFVVTSSDNETSIQDLNGNSLGKTMEGKFVGFSPDSKLIYTYSFQRNNMTFVWDLSGNKIREFSGRAIAISPDGKHIIRQDFGWSEEKKSFAKLLDINGNEIREFQTEGKTIIDAVFSSNGKYVLLISDYLEEIWDINGKRIKKDRGFNLSEGYNSKIGQNFSPDSKYILTGEVDGSVKVSTLEGNKYISIFLKDENDFLIYSDDGRFDYKGKGVLNSVKFRKGGTNELISLDTVFDKYYTPGLLSQWFSGKQLKPNEKSDELFKKSPPPSITISSNTTDKTEQSNSTVSVKACDKGGGVENIRLYHNGSAISLEETRGIKVLTEGKCQTKNFVVTLVSGLNEFKGSAKSKEGLEGFSEILEITYKAPEIKKPKQHVVIVAINEYRNPKFKLKYAIDDAKAFKDKIIQRGKTLFASTEVYEALDKDATREGIKAAFAKAAANSKPEDVAVIFFAGHGFSEDRKYYYIQQDNPANNEDAIKQGISQDELTNMISSIKALKKLVVLDTCQAGGDWLVALRGADEQAALGILAKSAGVWVIAASQEQQYALETSKTGHGLLTSTLLEGFDGKAKKGDKFVKPSGLIGWVNERVPSLAQELFKREQFPYTAQRGQDFPIGE